MKHLGDELEKIMFDRRIVKREVAKKLGLSAPHFYKVLKKETFDAALLERISNVIGISPAIFFNDYQTAEVANLNNNKNIAMNNKGRVKINQIYTETPEEEVRLLRQLLEEKERTIQLFIKGACNGTISGHPKK